MSVVSSYLIQSVQESIRDISQADVLLNVPTIRQSTDYSCGAATFSSILAFYGHDLPEKEVIDLMGTTKEGTNPESFLSGAKKFKLKSELREGMTIKNLRECLDERIPVILCIQAWGNKKDYNKEWEDGHYVAAIGYDLKGFYFMDPSQIGYSYLETGDLEDRWHDIRKDKKKTYTHLGIIIYGKEPKFNMDKIRPIQ
jgi:hypothetical protein